MLRRRWLCCPKLLTQFLITLMLASTSSGEPRPSPVPKPSESSTSDPGFGGMVSGELAPGQQIDLQLELDAGDYLHLRAHQMGVDFSLSLTAPLARDGSPGGESLRADRPISHSGHEDLLFVASTTGPHRLLVDAASSACGGEFRVEIVARRSASRKDRRRAEAFGWVLEGDPLRRRRDPASDALYERASQSFSSLGDLAFAAEAEHRRGYGAGQRSDVIKAERHYRRTTDLAAAASDDFWQMTARYALGALLLNLDRVAEARDELGVVLELAHQLGNRPREAQALRHLAQAAQRRGRPQEALDYGRRSLELWRDCELRDRGATRHTLGVLYANSFGQSELAIDLLDGALEDLQAINDTRNLATVHNQLAQAYHHRGDSIQARRRDEFAEARRRDDFAEARRRDDFAEARRHYASALGLRQGDDCPMAVSRVKLALLDADQGAPRRALKQARLAFEEVTATSCPRAEPTVRLALGQLLLDQGAYAEAATLYASSLHSFDRRGDRVRQVAALTGLARARQALGDPQALGYAERGLALAEGVRVSVSRRDLRTSFFATVQELYGLHIDLLMARGNAAGAFSSAEQARARALRDGLREIGADVRRFADPALLEREREVLANLNVQTGNRDDQLDKDQDTSALDADIRQLEDRLASLDAEIRRRSPRYAELLRPEPIHEREVRALLDTDTVLLEIRLGEEQSFAWSLDADGLESHRLPPRRDIEALADAAYLELSKPQRSNGRQPWDARVLCQLSRQVLGPAASRLGHRRLLLVLDGTLEALPFGALPHPDDCSTISDGDQAAEPLAPLVADREIVHLPSAATLASLRRRLAPPATRRWLAVVADPVYSPTDPRVATVPKTSTTASTTPSWQRLSGSGDEAQSILDKLPPERGFALLGVDASKARVLDGALRDARILHFATHGALDAERPARSHLVLSLYDAAGRAVDGVLYAHDIYNLELRSELAVLSACESGLGPRIPGEGLISGLARSFLYAGADRVVVSLWDVHDGATSELMNQFYDRLLAPDALQPSPPRALAEAQSAMWRDGWHPFFWSGFVLQGEWRPMSPLRNSSELATGVHPSIDQ